MLLSADLDTNLVLKRFKLIVQLLIVHFVTVSVLVKSLLQLVNSLLQELICLDLLILGLSQLDFQLVQLHVHFVLGWVWVEMVAPLLCLF